MNTPNVQVPGGNSGYDPWTERFASKPRLLELKTYLERFSWRTYMKSKYWDSYGVSSRD